MQLGAAAAATRRAPGALAAAAPHANRTRVQRAPGSSTRLLAKQAGACDRLGTRTAAAGPPGHRAQSPWAPESAMEESMGSRALKDVLWPHYTRPCAVLCG
eukprot:5789850-Prymnesium_polylepis.1